MGKNKILEYSNKFLLTEEETQLFISLLLKDNYLKQTAFIMVLLKELNYDIAKFLRVISVGFKTKGLLSRSLLNRILMLLRETVIINDLITKEVLKEITISELSRQTRYYDLGISRPMIYKTINKYKLDVLEKG